MRRKFDGMCWIVKGQRHSIERNDFEFLSIDLQIRITIGRGIHNTPELTFARSDSDRWSHDAIYREDSFWWFGRSTTGFRGNFNSAHQLRRGRDVLTNYLIPQHQDSLTQMLKLGNVAFNTIDYD